MGMFDSVWFKCPSCGEQFEEQSKSGRYCLDSYDSDSVPPAIAASLDGSIAKCHNCEDEYEIKVNIPQYVECFLIRKAADE